MDLEELVRAITREVLKQIKLEAEKAPVLVLNNRDEALAAKVRQCLGEDTRLIFLGEEIDGPGPTRHILPFLSCGAMAELALGQASGPVMSEVLRLLLRGAEVEVLEFEYKAHGQTAPRALYGLYEGHEKTLATYGIKEFKRMQPDTIRLQEDLVTEKTILQARDLGASRLLVPLTAKVTPLAADAARSMNINIVKRS